MPSPQDTASPWRRPAGRSGPARDPRRDQKILDAALSLLVEGGFGALTMERAAAKAGVGKSTVYRRWSTPAELAAEAFDRAGVVNAPAIVELGKGRVRDELLETLAATARCTGTDGSSALVAAMLETTRRHPEVSLAVQHRYLESIHTALMTVLQNAAQRGDLSADRLRAFGHRPIHVDAAIALLLHWQILQTDPLDLARIVDEILLPSFTDAAGETH